MNDLINIRNDIEQTLFRYENLNNWNQIEHFISSFDGNNKQEKKRRRRNKRKKEEEELKRRKVEEE